MSSLLYYFAFGLVWLISLLPFRVLYGISDLLYFIIYYGVGYRKKVVFQNLRTSFPNKSETEIIKLSKAFYHHFSDILLEIPKCIRISPANLDKRVKYINTEVFTDLANNNRNFALVSGHYNNWELLQNLPLKIKHKFFVIYRPLKNKISDRVTFYMRSRNKPIMTPMENIYRELLKEIAEKNMFSVWFLGDQRPPKNSKLWTTFLNHETAFFEGMERISRKLDLAVVFLDMKKVRRGHWEVRLEKLFDNAAQTSENEVTLACIDKIEQEILNQPEYWLWSHKRFKHSRPENCKLIPR